MNKAHLQALLFDAFTEAAAEALHDVGVTIDDVWTIADIELSSEGITVERLVMVARQYSVVLDSWGRAVSDCNRLQFEKARSDFAAPLAQLEGGCGEVVTVVDLA